ncbi:glucose-1-phosphate cytidylyltransferase [Stratiformator vulcanicus]|uniref:glucose-1-phosphate cytidylyltransferase n=1 Tax=Stratiformator vulcanicus TaxID=2527980 RepID=UPI0035C72170
MLFCGGMGMRLREYSESIPKPMVDIGYRPVLWHVMKYYAHFGHKDFILCLGWKADVIKQYFLEYDECASNDFVLSGDDKSVDLLASDIHDWRITFVDTGATKCIGERLKAVEPYLEGEQTFLANYTDGLCDVHLPNLIDLHERRNSVATFLSVQPTQSFHTVVTEPEGSVSRIDSVKDSDLWINAGFFVLDQSVFSYMRNGEELVEQPFRRLIEAEKLSSLRHEGFFACMDTFKEKQLLDDMYARSETPWELWKNESRRTDSGAVEEPEDRLARDVSELADEVGQRVGLNEVNSAPSLQTT